MSSRSQAACSGGTKNTWPSIGADSVSGVILGSLVIRHRYFCGFGLGHPFDRCAPTTPKLNLPVSAAEHACEMKADTATRAAVSVVHRLMVFLMIVLIGPLRLANHAVDRLHAEMPSGRSAEHQGDVRKLDVRSSGDADLQRG